METRVLRESVSLGGGRCSVQVLESLGGGRKPPSKLRERPSGQLKPKRLTTSALVEAIKGPKRPKPALSSKAFHRQLAGGLPSARRAALRRQLAA